jgi:hypothetical protein|tara:strand:+ start:444 stop:752 length:309 start_codon:yes stop_codon:yes gene_type:complete
MIEYFISVLLNVSIMGIDPPQGWLQAIKPYETKAECEAAIPEAAESIHMTVYQWTQGMGFIEAIHCMTEEEWIKQNEELGHDQPLWMNPGNSLPPEKKEPKM